MPSVGQIIALVAITAYLSAAFLPCEPDGELFSSARRSAETRVTPAEARATPSPSTSRPSHPSHHASHENQTGHSDHGAHDNREAQNSHHKVAMESSLVWMPTCLCGCGDSLAMMGGGAARLGPIVPPAPAAPGLSETVSLTTESVPRLLQAPDNLIDPIPT
jgi:hypothetical protein